MKYFPCNISDGYVKKIIHVKAEQTLDSEEFSLDSDGELKIDEKTEH